MDTGLGRDSLSIISQNNINEFVKSKPEDRRAMFEEAAGVAKYKKRKIETVRKLERTTDNLDRVQDICSELERQIGPLKRQKEKAPPTKGRRSGLRLGNGLQKGFDLPEHLLRAENIISVAKVQFHAVADSVPDLLPVQCIDG